MVNDTDMGVLVLFELGGHIFWLHLKHKDVVIRETTLRIGAARVAE